MDFIWAILIIAEPSTMNNYSIEPVVNSELYEVEEIRHLYDLFDVSFNDNLLYINDVFLWIKILNNFRL